MWVEVLSQLQRGPILDSDLSSSSFDGIDHHFSGSADLKLQWQIQLIATSAQKLHSKLG